MCIAAAVAMACLLMPSAIHAAQKKQKKEEITQTLALPPDPPAVATGETRRLVFQNVPLVNKGLLSQQTRDGLKTALRMASGTPVIHIRAFVAGSGDLRRVPQLVSEIFADKKVKLPSVSVIQVGALPMENAQIAIDTISVGKKEINPAGLDFIAGESIVENSPGLPARPLFDKAVESLAARVAGRAPVSVTCFVSGLQNMEMTSVLAAKFTGAAAIVVQPQRAPYQTYASCQAVVRGGSKAAIMAFSGTRVSSGTAESQSALTLQRLDRDLAEAGAAANSLLFTNIYSLIPQAAAAVQKLRAGAMTIVPVESVASVQAAFAVDSVSAVNK
jgi:enamine deaminase RidA (YjgF/YER057c/UK114 family)